jgi:phenylacetate-coenzyme A ligase PaaK-like adenylate-forming protein
MTATDINALVKAAKEQLDAHAYEIVQWHFHESTGCPFWLAKKAELNFDPLTHIKCYDDLKKFPNFEDEWLRGGPIRRWVPKAYEGRPTYVFETGGTTGIPKSRMVIEDYRIDYEIFSDTLPDAYFPKGANWLMFGPSGPRRLRLAVEHLCQYRGGICFCIDLDPRWVVKLLKRNMIEEAELYKQHCIYQAITILTAGHDVKCMFATPKLLDALALALEERGTSLKEIGITGIFSGGTEFTPQWTRYCVEELFGGPAEESGIYMTPTYGNTLMGLACSKPVTKEDDYKIAYYAPQPRAVTEVVEFEDSNTAVDYGETGRVKLTTLTKELFVPGFLERDEGEREKPFETFPWDGVSGVRPYHVFAKSTTVGVYYSHGSIRSAMSHARNLRKGHRLPTG